MSVSIWQRVDVFANSIGTFLWLAERVSRWERRADEIRTRMLLDGLEPHRRFDLGLPPRPTAPPEHPAVKAMQQRNDSWT